MVPHGTMQMEAITTVIGMEAVMLIVRIMETEERILEEQQTKLVAFVEEVQVVATSPIQNQLQAQLARRCDENFVRTLTLGLATEACR